MFKPAANIQGCLTADAVALANVLEVDDNTWAYLNFLLASGDWTYMRIGVAPNSEVVRVVSAIGYQLQVARGLDGTNPTAYPAGTEVSYVMGEAAVIDIVAANPAIANAVTITGIAPIIVEQTATNVFAISSEEFSLTSDGTIDVLGEYPNIQIGVSGSAGGCGCG